MYAYLCAHTITMMQYSDTAYLSWLDSWHDLLHFTDWLCRLSDFFVFHKYWWMHWRQGNQVRYPTAHPDPTTLHLQSWFCLTTSEWGHWITLCFLYLIEKQNYTVFGKKLIVLVYLIMWAECSVVLQATLRVFLDCPKAAENVMGLWCGQNMCRFFSRLSLLCTNKLSCFIG